MVRFDLELLVENDRRGFLPAAHLGTKSLPLFVGAPEGVAVATILSGSPQRHYVDTVVSVAAGSILRQQTGESGAVPGHYAIAGAGLNGGDDAIGDGLMDIEFGFHGRGLRECRAQIGTIPLPVRGHPLGLASSSRMRETVRTPDGRDAPERSVPPPAPGRCAVGAASPRPGSRPLLDTVDLTYLVDCVGEVAALMDGTTVKVKADAGGLMGCGADPSTRRAAGYIDKDPQSLKPSDLPVEQAVIVIAVALIVAGRA